MRPLTVGICAEIAPGERRVALVPRAVGLVRALGLRVLVEQGAGVPAGFPDHAYTSAGADVAGRQEVVERSGILLSVRRPGRGARDRLRPGQALIGLLRPARDPLTVRHWADHAITAISLDLMEDSPGLPSAAASQERISGSEAVLLATRRAAGHRRNSAFPSSEGRPLRVLVIGTGTAGTAAVRTARLLGAEVEACGDDGQGAEAVRAMGAAYDDLATAKACGAVEAFFAGVLPSFDILVVTPWASRAARPSWEAEPGTLIGARTMAAMRPGSVIVDATVEAHGGAVEQAVPGDVVTVPPGVTVIGAGNLPSCLARASSTAFALGLVPVLRRIVSAGTLAIDLDDSLQDAIVVTHRGQIRDETVVRRISDLTAIAGLP